MHARQPKTYPLKTSILTPQHFVTSQWSGGSTTQLYISPVGASYAERNFDVRISTAKVEIEESTFTALPGVHRKLMILEGEITVTHKNQYSKYLKPFEVDIFSGDWDTSAVGTCTDFNVMTTGQHKSELYHLKVSAKNNHELKPKTDCKILCIYTASGSLEITLDTESHTLPTGYLLVIEYLSVSSISLSCKETCGLVVVEIYQTFIKYDST